MDVKNKRMSIVAVNQLIDAGNVLVLAGDEQVLKQLNKGNWIGGTTPYFMDHAGGGMDQQQVFVTDFTESCSQLKIGVYDSREITKEMLADRYADGFSYVLIPAFSEIHQAFALNNRKADSLFDVPTIGWITGIHLDDIGKKTPKVINGNTGKIFGNEACVLHCQLSEGRYAEIDIVNIYEQGNGDKITFLENSFSCSDCLINGELANLADYYLDNEIDVSLPLVANYSGAYINVSIEHVDAENKEVGFYAPVLKTQEYHIARAIPDLFNVFNQKLLKETKDVVCSCNCILNYLNLELDSRSLGNFNGPFTFGEIAYVLVNQTMVTLQIHD